MDPYTDWLRQTNEPLFEKGGTLWRRYRRGLVPAGLKPAPVRLTPREEAELLKASGSLFLRHFTETSSEPTDFWYTACSEYNLEKNAKSELRRRVKRAHERFTVCKVDPFWLSFNGYDCYAAAFARYENSTPVSRRAFEESCQATADGPFEYWGTFLGDKLVGFAKCAVVEDYVAVLVSKLDPEYLPIFSSYALRDALLRTYVREQGKVVGDGFRSIAHKSAMHEFLLKFGYNRVYCDLRVVYRPLVHACVALAFPLRGLISRLPTFDPVTGLQVLLTQEGIRRSFA